MKREYQDLIDRDIKKVENAKSPAEKKLAVEQLEATKSVINALLFNEKEMKKLS